MNRVQSLRSSVAGNRPATGTRAPGELWVNFSDNGFGVIDAAQTSRDLLPVRYWIASANYVVGDFALNGGEMFRCLAPNANDPPPSANWAQVTVAGGPILTGYLPLAGGTMTGPIVLSGDAATALNPVSLQQLQAGYLPLTGGTMTGGITLPAGAPAGAADAAPKSYVDAQDASTLASANNAAASTYLPLAGGTMTGPLTGVSSSYNPGPVVVTNNAGVAGFAASTVPGQAVHINGQKNGVNRWIVELGDATAEGGANAGSNFSILPFNDAGATLAGGVSINRANSVVNILGVGAQPYSATAALGVGTAAVAFNKNTGAFNNNLLGTTSGVLRWNMALGDSTAEGGANAGSNFALTAYSDAGAGLGAAFTIARATRVVTFSQAIVNGSDRRLKENIVPIEDALAKVNALQGVTYTTLDNDKQHIGLIAQDTQPVLPEVVFETGQPLDAEGKEIEGEEPMLGISYGNVVAVLIEAVKELSAKVAALEAA